MLTMPGASHPSTGCGREQRGAWPQARMLGEAPSRFIAGRIRAALPASGRGTWMRTAEVGTGGSAGRHRRNSATPKSAAVAEFFRNGETAEMPNQRAMGNAAGRAVRCEDLVMTRHLQAVAALLFTVVAGLS